MARKFSAFTNNPSRVPLDTLVGLDISAAAAAQNSYWSLNTLFSEITGNVTDGAIRFGGFAAPSVSAAGKAALYFDSTSNTLKLSQNTGAYADVRSGTVTVPQGGTGLTTLTAYALMAGGTTATGNMQQVSGVGTSGQALVSNGAGALPTWQTLAGTIGGSIAINQVAVGSGANTIAGSSAFTFASGVAAIQGTANPGLTITGTAATESGITVNQSVSGAAADAFHSFQTPSSTMLFRLTTAGFTPSGLVKANQIDMLGATGTVEMLFRLADASTRFVFGVNNAEAASINATATEGLVLGVASSLTGRVKLFNSTGATYTQLSAGNAAASLNYILPATSPSAGYVLSASAPSGSDVTLSWAAAASVTALTATQVGFGDGSNLLSGSADFTYTTAAGQLSISKTVNGSMYMAVTNGGPGTAAQARFGAAADVAGAAIAAYSSTFTTSGLITANTALLDLDAPNALIKAQTGQTLTLAMGNTARATLTDAQMAVLTAPTTGAGLAVSASTVTSGSLVSLSMTGTAAASNTKTALAVTSTGANGTASQTVTVASFSCTNTGTTNTNVALNLNASGGATANTALFISAGNVLFTDNQYDIGASGANRPRSIYLSAGVEANSGPSTFQVVRTGFINNNNNTNIVFTLTNGTANVLFADGAATPIIQFAGITSSFPALGRSGTSLSIGLADGTLQCLITPKAAANLQFGAADAASPVAQTISVQSVVAGTADTAGANWTFIGSRGTGTGAGGNLIWQVAPAGGAGSSQNALINGLVLTSTGNLYGAALHNNSTSPTGTTNQYIASGTYTPTVTAVANCTATSSGPCNWIRVGNVVTVSGILAVDPTSATTFTSVGISLPIASNFATNASECAGVAANANVQGYSGAISADFANDRAQLDFTTAVDVSNQAWSFSFTYVVL